MHHFKTEPQSSLFTGDSVTLRCEVDQSQDGWEFLWSKNSNTESTEAANKTIDSLKVSDGGEYKCRAQRRGLYTNYSESVTVTIYGKYFHQIMICSENIMKMIHKTESVIITALENNTSV
uniref:Ig-like domain-containing protein n=1 Tax=Cyprinus carpio TaxID=7962 RepID=A0A8C1WTA8_CYPCA